MAFLSLPVYTRGKPSLSIRDHDRTAAIGHTWSDFKFIHHRATVSTVPTELSPLLRGSPNFSWKVSCGGNRFYSPFVKPVAELATSFRFTVCSSCETFMQRLNIVNSWTQRYLLWKFLLVVGENNLQVLMWIIVRNDLYFWNNCQELYIMYDGPKILLK